MSYREENYAFYRLNSRLFDHHDLTAATGIYPWEAGNFGELRNARSRFRNTMSYWMARGRDPDVADFELHLAHLFNLLDTAWPTLCDYGKVYGATVWLNVCLCPHQPAPRLVFPPEVLQRIVALHATLAIDPYCADDEELTVTMSPHEYEDSVMITQRRATVTYALSGTGLEPHAITRRTGLIPSRTWSPVEYSSGTRARWEFDARRVTWGVRGTRDELPALLDELQPAIDQLTELGHEFSATVTLEALIDSQEQSSGMSLDAALLQRLVDLNATLDIRYTCRHTDLLYFEDDYPTHPG